MYPARKASTKGCWDHSQDYLRAFRGKASWFLRLVKRTSLPLPVLFSLACWKSVLTFLNGDRVFPLEFSYIVLFLGVNRSHFSPAKNWTVHFLRGIFFFLSFSREAYYLHQKNWLPQPAPEEVGCLCTAVREASPGKGSLSFWGCFRAREPRLISDLTPLDLAQQLQTMSSQGEWLTSC